ncbi:Uncharacterised protein [Clostridioides difficile]|uniref:hypothetical protein n=1 Tax=Clostridioides difficile TaxID=1496 RepID=UPI0010266E5C|nr:hypothetical protein [Clostridioides difficile]VFF93608.1 Uncharacterised protein [Clostridioides difficile]VIG04163.1 Uncharacterised protein [Clostridioides difficile]HBF4772011.1 hypothetical protein [Clostridioides difficile]HBF5037940.1 hypothetical protein [Clostridioides difficile]HBF5410665.1 hypothetical protein [Clostridioides difficile]
MVEIKKDESDYNTIKEKVIYEQKSMFQMLSSLGTKIKERIKYFWRNFLDFIEPVFFSAMAVFMCLALLFISKIMDKQVTFLRDDRNIINNMVVNLTHIACSFFEGMLGFLLCLATVLTFITIVLCIVRKILD